MIINEIQILNLMRIARDMIEYGRLDKKQKAYLDEVWKLLDDITNQQSKELKEIK